MPQAIITSQMQIGGTTMQASNTLTGNGQESYEATIAAAETGTLTTHTDVDTGVVTIANTTLSAADKVLAYWDDAGTRKSRTDMTVADVTGDAVTIDGGDGDDLPAQDSAISLAVQAELAVSFDGDDLVAIGVTSERDATAVYYDAGGLVLLKTELYAGHAWSWQAGSGLSSPITGNAVARVVVACRDTGGTSQFVLGMLQNV